MNTSTHAVETNVTRFLARVDNEGWQIHESHLTPLRTIVTEAEPYSKMGTGNSLQSNIIHPCQSWAVAAGFESWSVALEAMRAGQVCTGPTDAIQSSSKSMLGLTLFMEEIQKVGMHAFAPEDGSNMVVGFEKNFSAEILAEQEKQNVAMARRFPAMKF